MTWRWAPEFTEAEFACQCGQCGGDAKMDESFMDTIHAIRLELGAPMIVTSGYRCERHPDEQDKLARGVRGDHHQGRGADFIVAPQRKAHLVALAYRHGIRRIGCNWKGRGQFTHLGAGIDLPSPASWSY